jgi:hypothetical protein
MATTAYTVNSTAWANCGATPCTLQAPVSKGVLYVVNGTVPGSLDAAAHTLIADNGRPVEITQDAQFVYVRAVLNTSFTVVASR